MFIRLAYKSLFLYKFAVTIIEGQDLLMKKLIFILLSAVVLPVFSQTYQELTDSGFELMEQDSLTHAEEVFRQAMKLEPANPHNAMLFSNIGIIQRHLNKYEDAIESFTYALNITPLSIPVLLNRGAVYLELGRTDRAYLDYCRILDQERDNMEALLMRAYIYIIRRDYNAARIDYNRLLQVDPFNYSGRLGLISLNQKEKKFSDAMEMLNNMIIELPEDITLYLMRAGITMDMEQYDSALLDLEEAMRINPKSPDVYLHRGELYLLQNKKAQAKQEFEKAIALGIPQSELREKLQRCR